VNDRAAVVQTFLPSPNTYVSAETRSFLGDFRIRPRVERSMAVVAQYNQIFLDVLA